MWNQKILHRIAACNQKLDVFTVLAGGFMNPAITRKIFLPTQSLYFSTSHSLLSWSKQFIIVNKWLDLELCLCGKKKSVYGLVSCIGSFYGWKKEEWESSILWQITPPVAVLDILRKSHFSDTKLFFSPIKYKMPFQIACFVLLSLIPQGETKIQF